MKVAKASKIWLDYHQAHRTKELNCWRDDTVSTYLQKSLLNSTVGSTFKDTIGGVKWASYQILFR